MSKLLINSPAPKFSTTDYLGNAVELVNYKCKKVLLCFFRDAPCPFCNMRIHEMIERYSEFQEKGIEIIAFFVGTKEEIGEYAAKQEPPFAIVPDPKMEIYKQYGIEHSRMGKMRLMFHMKHAKKVMKSKFMNKKSRNYLHVVPADILIDTNQDIIKVLYGRHYGDHMSFDSILNG